MNLAFRGINPLLRNDTSNVIKTLKSFLASPAKGTSAFSGGKLGGGVSKKGAQTQKKIEMQVETDPNKLAKFCCGLNIMKTGGSEVELKPDSEYPAWLWELSVEGRGPTLDEMQPNTLEWWTRKRRIALRYKHKLMRDQFPKPFIPKSYKNMRLA